MALLSQAPLPTSPGASRADPSPRYALPPLLPVILPILIAVIVLSVILARWFPAPAAHAVPVARFTDITEESGIHFRHRQGGAETPTTLGGGVAVIDYDRDGHPDLFFVNGTAWPWENPADAATAPSVCALFRNDGHGHFSDVSAEAGLAVSLQGMCPAVGDYDGDGFPDLFITAIGGNRLFHNRGNGRFEEVTATAGVGGDANTWSTGATWIDFDGDGALDLVVANYARWPGNVGLRLAFTIADVGHSYGTPAGFFSAFPSVYRNLGGGHFALVANSAGLRDIDRQTGLPMAKPLAIVPVDANGDGRLDLLFSYQTSPAALFLNQGDGTFRPWNIGREDRREGASAALVSASVRPFARSGSDDERLQALLFASMLDAHAHEEMRLSLPAKLGIVPFDYDLDGRLEIFSGEGRAEPDLNKFEPERAFRTAPLLLVNDGRAWKTAAASGADGTAWANPVIARGVAVADLDGDGDLDVIIAQNNAAPVLLRNDQRRGSPWLRLQLTATRSQRDAGGALVEVQTPTKTIFRQVAPALSYFGQSEAVLTFGLGEDARVRRIVIHWPSGQRQELRPTAVNQTLTLTEP
jgi:hypothetical protein